MKDIENRKDVDLLIRSFYTKVRKDELIGPIFNSVIHTDEQWEHHFDKLINFWESNLLGALNYQGNPMAMHLMVDRNTDYKIDDSYFERWLKLWFETIDETFTGVIANSAKDRAVNIGKTMLAKMMFVREKYR